MFPTLPTLTAERFAQLHAKLKPVVEVDGALHYIVPVDPKNQAFTWDPKPVDALSRYQEVGRITTYHTCGYIGLFKPSIEEVLCQVPDHIAEAADCFQTLKEQATPVGGEGHRTTTIFYKDGTTREEKAAAVHKAEQITLFEEQETAAKLAITAPKHIEADDQVARFVKDVVYVVEATSFEKMCLWRQYHEDPELGWTDNNSGYAPTVGYLAENPVCVSLFITRLCGYDVLMMDATSSVVDHRMIESWLKEYCPKAVNERGGLRDTNAMNFHNVVRYVKEAAEVSA